MKASFSGDGASKDTFSSLKIWRQKVVADINSLPTTDDFKLRMLVEQTKDLEQAVFGCLHSTLFELNEAKEWGLATPASFVQTQRTSLFSHAAQELANDKQLMLELAREQGEEMLAAYKAEILKGDNTAEYETIGSLRFALLVWHVVLNQRLSFTETDADGEQILIDAYRDGMKLVRRCVANWAAEQKSTGGPEFVEKETVYGVAEAKVRRICKDAAASHHLNAAAALANVVGEDDEDVDEDVGTSAEKGFVPPVKGMYNVEEAEKGVDLGEGL